MGKVKSNSNGDVSKVCGISRKYPSYRSYFPTSMQSWLNGKRKDDEAEGLWRIDDTLYDFTDFMGRHPGGAFWLEETKGTDITYPFESHHISTLPKSMLAKYKVRRAAQPRNYTLTLSDDGFYATLKSRVREKLPHLDYSPSKKTELMHFGLLVATIGLSLATSAFGNAIIAIFAGLSLAWLSIAAHNFFHRRDNWQMYTFNLILMNFSMWRVSHALSHHVYPNTHYDLEITMFEPFLNWIPNPLVAPKLWRVVSVFIQPVVYTVVCPIQFVSRIVESLMRSNVMYWHDLIGFVLPALMFVISDAPFTAVLCQWFLILAVASFIFGLIGLNAAHHHPKIYHEGDASRSDRDWGLFQIDTLIDRADIKGSQFMVLTHFGDHALHHLFPTLDHGVLPQLYPVLLETLAEFKADLRECSFLQHIIGQSKQLVRTNPNPIPPGGDKAI